MADRPRSFQDLVRRRQKAAFVGRDGELALFTANLALPAEERRLLFSVHGDGGMGKTSLLGRLREVAREQGWLTARTDESVFEVVEVMADLARQIETEGGRLKRFTQLHTAHRKRRPDNAEGMADLVTKAATSVTTGVVNTLVPGAGVVTKAIDPEQVNQLRLATMDKLRAPAPVSPVDELTPAFLEGLRELGRPLALFFDTYEVTSAHLDEWLRAVFSGRYGEAPMDLLVILAGRQPLDPLRWDPYLGIVADLRLTPFTEVEVRRLLEQMDVEDEEIIEVITRETGGLPLAVAMLGRLRPTGPDTIHDPSSGLVDRFLKWEQDPARRDLALEAALPRQVDRDIVGVLTGDDASELYTWLNAQDFLTRRAASAATTTWSGSRWSS